ncbi:hypothetical protein AwDysgo_05950 [Bacteroidales bacterium]|nr:hypothetical protein AwDysgo_05950 [Bacteroidales bacterium]
MNARISIVNMPQMSSIVSAESIFVSANPQMNWKDKIENMKDDTRVNANFDGIF